MTDKSPPPMTDLDLIQLNPRQEMPRIRQAIRARVASGRSPASLIRALAVRDPQTLAHLLIGPRPIAAAPVLTATLDVLDTLESVIQPNKLYPRLADIARTASGEVLRAAILRHPGSPWLIPLSARVEGPLAGVQHLRLTAGQVDFPDICHQYASAGHVRGLIQVAGDLATAWPAAALARVGAAGPAAQAAARALARDPEVPVVAWLAATWGPDIEDLLLQMVPYLRDLAAIRALRRQAGTWPSVMERLRPLDQS